MYEVLNLKLYFRIMMKSWRNPFPFPEACCASRFVLGSASAAAPTLCGSGSCSRRRRVAVAAGPPPCPSTPALCPAQPAPAGQGGTDHRRSGHLYRTRSETYCILHTIKYSKRKYSLYPTQMFTQCNPW